MRNSCPFADCAGQTPTNAKSCSELSTSDGLHPFYCKSLFLIFIIIECTLVHLAFVYPHHIADIEHLSLRCSCVPTSRCTNFPLVLDSVSAFFCVVHCYYCTFFLTYCCIKGVCFLIHHRCLIASATLIATFIECGFD